MVLINGKFDQFVNSILVDPHKNHYANVAVWMSLMDQLSCLDFFFFWPTLKNKVICQSFKRVLIMIIKLYDFIFSCTRVYMRFAKLF